MDPLDKVGRMKAMPAFERMDECRSALFLQHFLTPKENERVQKRIIAWCERNGCPVSTKPVRYIELVNNH